MRFHIHRFTRSLAALAFVATPAFAGDFYVDAMNGNDANGGTSTLDAWRTLTHALVAIPATPLVDHAIHVAPGTYDPALGEAYPLIMRPGMRLLGTDGSAMTFLEGPGLTLLRFKIDHNDGLGWPPFDAWSGAEGLTLRHADRAIELASNWQLSTPMFGDLVIDDMTSVGIHLSKPGYWGSGNEGIIRPAFTDVMLANCGTGVVFDVHTSNPSIQASTVTFTDCTIRNCTGSGISIVGTGFQTATLTLYRCRIVDNALDGVTDSAVPHLNAFRIVAEDTLIAGNARAGLYGQEPLDTVVHTPRLTYFDLRQCTIARNAFGMVFSSIAWPDWKYKATLWNCNVYGNTTKDFSTPYSLPPIVSPLAIAEGHSSNGGDGFLLGHPGCIAIDPAFRNAVAGDYRLAFGSPCIDSGDPAFMTAVDLFGRARSFDGNVDTVVWPDMGAMEFATLDVADFQPLSTRIVLELWGPDYGRSILYLSDAPVLTTPEATPFGSFYLVRSTAVVIPMARMQSRTSNLLELKIPALAVPGSTVSLQALIRSQSAPAGAAWSNPIQLVVAP